MQIIRNKGNLNFFISRHNLVTLGSYFSHIEAETPIAANFSVNTLLNFR